MCDAAVSKHPVAPRPPPNLLQGSGSGAMHTLQGRLLLPLASAQHLALRASCFNSAQQRSHSCLQQLQLRRRANRKAAAYSTLTTVSAARAEDSRALDVCCFTVIVDDIVNPDGRTVMGAMGGGGASRSCKFNFNFFFRPQIA